MENSFFVFVFVFLLLHLLLVLLLAADSADYRVSGLCVPRGSWDGQVLEELKPAEDEIVLKKSSCNVFVSTNIDYLLRCLGISHLIVSGKSPPTWRVPLLCLCSPC